MIKFNTNYFILSFLLFFIEVLIAKYATGFIRHSVGDYLCVILLYTFIKSFIKLSVEKTAFIVLFISFLVEFIQLIDLQNMYPEKYKKTLNIILGTSFSIGDLIAYTLGVVTVIIIERKLKK